MKSLSLPSRNLMCTKKYCSDINLLTKNIIDELPGEYELQLKLVANQLKPLNSSLSYDQKQLLSKCRENLFISGKTDLVDDLDRLIRT